jgi:thymidylate synthase (FAD)
MKVKLIAKPTLTHDITDFLEKSRGDQLRGSDAETIIEIAGRICYDSFGSGRNSSDFHDNILAVNHGSVMEHAQYTFHINGVSRNLTHELVRHRVGVAISQRSTRYCDESESEVVIHPLLRVNDKTTEPLDEQVKHAYLLLVDLLERRLVNEGLSKTNARKQARGAARGALPSALSTELIWSANVRALRHVIQMRISKSADEEIRELARELLKIMQMECPAYFSDIEDPDLENVNVK